MYRRFSPESAASTAGLPCKRRRFSPTNCSPCSSMSRGSSKDARCRRKARRSHGGRAQARLRRPLASRRPRLLGANRGSPRSAPPRARQRRNDPPISAQARPLQSQSHQGGRTIGCCKRNLALRLAERVPCRPSSDELTLLHQLCLLDREEQNCDPSEVRVPSPSSDLRKFHYDPLRYGMKK
jgi:hypothetical protein